MDHAIYRDSIMNRRFFFFTAVWPVQRYCVRSLYCSTTFPLKNLFRTSSLCDSFLSRLPHQCLSLLLLSLRFTSISRSCGTDDALPLSVALLCIPITDAAATNFPSGVGNRRETWGNSVNSCRNGLVQIGHCLLYTSDAADDC